MQDLWNCVEVICLHFSNHFFNDPSCYNCYTAPLLMSLSDVITNAISRVKETSRQELTKLWEWARAQKKLSEKQLKVSHFVRKTAQSVRFCAVNWSCRGWPVWFACNKHWLELAACWRFCTFHTICLFQLVYFQHFEMYKSRAQGADTVSGHCTG